MTPLPTHLSLDESAVYQICVQGRLESKWSLEFPGMEISTTRLESGMTLTCLVGSISDQPSLHGILNKIRDFNLVLISVKLILTESFTNSNGSTL